MRNIILFAAAQVSALKMKTHAEASALVERPPALEGVARNLSSNLTSQIPNTVPSEMDHFLCSFETSSNSTEWNRLGCSRWYNSTSSSAASSSAPATSGPVAPPINSTVTVGGGSWRKVRHTPAGSTWGPFTDQLSGS